MPPGAAQASRTRAPGRRAARPRSSGAARCAAASWTETSALGEAGQLRHRHRPAQRDRRRRRARPPSIPLRGERLDVGRRRSCAAALTRRVIGGCTLSASAIACQRSGQSARRRSSHQSGWLKRASGSASAAATIASRSRPKRRRTALTKPALRGARRARRRHGLVDQRVLGVGRIARRPEQRQRDEQERVDLGRRRLRREPARAPTSAAPSQRSAWKASACVPGRARRRTARQRVVERLAAAHRARPRRRRDRAGAPAAARRSMRERSRGRV